MLQNSSSKANRLMFNNDTFGINNQTRYVSDKGRIYTKQMQVNSADQTASGVISSPDPLRQEFTSVTGMNKLIQGDESIAELSDSQSSYKSSAVVTESDDDGAEKRL